MAQKLLSSQKGHNSTYFEGPGQKKEGLTGSSSSTCLQFVALWHAFVGSCDKLDTF